MNSHELNLIKKTQTKKQLVEARSTSRLELQPPNFNRHQQGDEKKKFFWLIFLVKILKLLFTK
jgi:hypothetical protein